MTDPKTLPQTMAEVSASFKELQRTIGSTVLPSLLRLNEQLVILNRELYLARLKRWLPFVAFMFVLCVLIGWWIT
jgi:hypothetical protein